jgi:hypothetical protein
MFEWIRNKDDLNGNNKTTNDLVCSERDKLWIVREENRTEERFKGWAMTSCLLELQKE